MIKAACVGVGYLGGFHAEKYAASKEAELVAVVDIDSTRAAKVAKKVKCQAFTDYKELPSLGVECASVACDTSQHYAVAFWLLEHGIDVLLEKPMTETTAQAETLISCAKEKGRVLQIGHLERFNPAFRATMKLLSKPGFFEVRRISPFAGRGADVDVVLDLMIHDIDIVTHLVGREVTAIEAIGIPVLTKSVDVANARLTFDGGAVANFTASRAAFISERTIRIFQPDLYISIDFGSKKLKVYQKSGELDTRGYPTITVTKHKVEERDALQDEISSFLDAVRARSKPLVSGEDGLRALQLAEKIRGAFEVSAQRFKP